MDSWEVGLCTEKSQPVVLSLSSAPAPSTEGTGCVLPSCSQPDPHWSDNHKGWVKNNRALSWGLLQPLMMLGITQTLLQLLNLTLPPHSPNQMWLLIIARILGSVKTIRMPEQITGCKFCWVVTYVNSFQVALTFSRAQSWVCVQHGQSRNLLCCTSWQSKVKDETSSAHGSHRASQRSADNCWECITAIPTSPLAVHGRC